jgi:hypothetical protein
MVLRLREAQEKVKTGLFKISREGRVWAFVLGV